MGVWEIIGGIAALASILAICFGPVIKLNANIVKLTCSIESLKESTDRNCRNIDEISHTVNEHETRISVLESKEAE